MLTHAGQYNMICQVHLQTSGSPKGQNWKHEGIINLELFHDAIQCQHNVKLCHIMRQHAFEILICCHFQLYIQQY